MWYVLIIIIILIYFVNQPEAPVLYDRLVYQPLSMQHKASLSAPEVVLYNCNLYNCPSVVLKVGESVLFTSGNRVLFGSLQAGPGISYTIGSRVMSGDIPMFGEEFPVEDNVYVKNIGKDAGGLP